MTANKIYINTMEWDRFKGKLIKIGRNLRPVSQQDADEIAKIYGREMLTSARLANIHDFKSALSVGLSNPMRVDRETVVLTLPGYFYSLDHMRPHWIDVDEPANAPIKEWATRIGWEYSPEHPHHVFVRPHPFITRGQANARKQIDHKIDSGNIRVLKEFDKL